VRRRTLRNIGAVTRLGSATWTFEEMTMTKTRKELNRKAASILKTLDEKELQGVTGGTLGVIVAPPCETCGLLGSIKQV
jgi:bacteriocin-like protein